MLCTNFFPDSHILSFRNYKLLSPKPDRIKCSNPYLDFSIEWICQPLMSKSWQDRNTHPFINFFHVLKLLTCCFQKLSWNAQPLIYIFYRFEIVSPLCPNANRMKYATPYLHFHFFKNILSSLHPKVEKMKLTTPYLHFLFFWNF